MKIEHYFFNLCIYRAEDVYLSEELLFDERSYVFLEELLCYGLFFWFLLEDFGTTGGLFLFLEELGLGPWGYCVGF